MDFSLFRKRNLNKYVFFCLLFAPLSDAEDFFAKH